MGVADRFWTLMEAIGLCTTIYVVCKTTLRTIDFYKPARFRESRVVGGRQDRADQRATRDTRPHPALGSVVRLDGRPNLHVVDEAPYAPVGVDEFRPAS